MKVLILAGGLGTRLSEETDIKPKPMVEIGDHPILWHIMKLYSHYGYNDFVILLGYKGYVIKEYFANYFLHHNDVTFDLKNNKMKIHNNVVEPWTVTLVETGISSMTGGRVRRAKHYIGDEPFMLTYGDGIGDVDLKALVNFHNSHDGMLTMTSVQPEGRYGSVDIADDGSISEFIEKPKGDGAWINGGFFVCNPEVLDHIENDDSVFEKHVMDSIVEKNKIYSYKHHGLWRCMDTQRDKYALNELWKTDAPWGVWNK